MATNISTNSPLSVFSELCKYFRLGGRPHPSWFCHRVRSRQYTVPRTWKEEGTVLVETTKVDKKPFMTQFYLVIKSESAILCNVGASHVLGHCRPELQRNNETWLYGSVASLLDNKYKVRITLGRGRDLWPEALPGWTRRPARSSWSRDWKGRRSRAGLLGRRPAVCSWCPAKKIMDRNLILNPVPAELLPIASIGQPGVVANILIFGRNVPVFLWLVRKDLLPLLSVCWWYFPPLWGVLKVCL